MQDFSATNFHIFIIFISRYIFLKIANIIKLVMNGLLFSKTLRMQYQDGHQFLFLFFLVISALDILQMSQEDSVQAT